MIRYSKTLTAPKTNRMMFSNEMYRCRFIILAPYKHNKTSCALQEVFLQNIEWTAISPNNFKLYVYGYNVIDS